MNVYWKYKAENLWDRQKTWFPSCINQKNVKSLEITDSSLQIHWSLFVACIVPVAFVSNVQSLYNKKNWLKYIFNIAGIVPSSCNFKNS